MKTLKVRPWKKKGPRSEMEPISSQRVAFFFSSLFRRSHALESLLWPLWGWTGDDGRPDAAMEQGYYETEYRRVTGTLVSIRGVSSLGA